MRKGREREEASVDQLYSPGARQGVASSPSEVDASHRVDIVIPLLVERFRMRLRPRRVVEGHGVPEATCAASENQPSTLWFGGKADAPKVLL